MTGVYSRLWFEKAATDGDGAPWRSHTRSYRAFSWTRVAQDWRATMDRLLITGRLDRLMLIKINLVAGTPARPTYVSISRPSARELTIGGMISGRGTWGGQSQARLTVTTTDFKASDTKRSVRIYCGVDFLMSLSVARRNECLVGGPPTNVPH